MDTRLQITHTTSGGCPVVAASGEVDMSTARHLASAIIQATAPGATLIVDLSAITFMDSTGLHALLAGDRNAAACHASLVFTPSPIVVRLFELSGADQVLAVSPSVADAASISAAPRSHPESKSAAHATDRRSVAG